MKEKIIITLNATEGDKYIYELKSNNATTILEVTKESELEKGCYYQCCLMEAEGGEIFLNKIRAIRKQIQKMIRKNYQSSVIYVK